MRKLLIVDPSLQSLEGHSYNYDLAIYQAAARRFDQVVVYADRGFHDTSGSIKHCQAVLNRLRVDRLKRSVNNVFHRLGGKATHDGVPAHATVVPGVWAWMIGLAKWLRERDLLLSLRSILREHSPQDELHIFIQHAHLSELRLAARWRMPAHLHLVLRYAPDIVGGGQMSEQDLGELVSGLGRSVHLFTDSERLTAAYAALGARDVRTLPVPILLPELKVSTDDGTVRLAFLGTSRVEKGYCELPRIIQRLPREVAGRQFGAMIQVTADSADPRIRAATQVLVEVARGLPKGTLELLESPVPTEVYYGWLARAGIVALPYLSRKYNASTSGIFVEALCFGVPVVCPADSWMGDVITEARESGLRIGEVVNAIDEVPAAAARIAASLPAYRDAVHRFAVRWRRTHNADECIVRLLEAAA